jgi:glycogen debranching enzyme
MDRLSLPSLLVAFLLSSTVCAAAHGPLDSLGIEVRGSSREFAFTNKQSAFFYGETGSRNTTSWQGFNVAGFEFIDDYSLLIDGRELPRNTAVRTVVYPDFLRREYPGGIIEELHPIDSLAAFIVTVIAPRPVEVGFVPWFTDGRTRAEFESVRHTASVLIARKRHPSRTDAESYPVWLAMYAPAFFPRDTSRTDGDRFSPVFLYAGSARRHSIFVLVGDDQAETDRLVRRLPATAPRLMEERRRRMEHILGRASIRTHDARFDKALAWATLSLDALIMNQRGKGIFAGLPWFNNYWGRDTFISLPGATLVTGGFADARDILRSFAEHQERDSTSSNYGRIPNFVSLTEKAYNTADGTPRFVTMVREYVERSGDSLFALEMYAVVLRSIEGTIKFHSDSLGFLTHGDAETWMDAVGPDGPWSPRGNRANDIQALWAAQLETGIWLATRIGDPVSAQRWDIIRRSVVRNFTPAFLFNGRLADHLLPDGSRDTRLRPNQIFATSLLNDSLRLATVTAVTESLTYPYGVASLSQEDADFHPYHQYPPFYPKDAAYHNGTVWTWLEGKLISELIKAGGVKIAARLTENTVHQILDRAGVGTQSELLDALSRPGETEPRPSGTFSQAWNLAEFVRNAYEDYLGVRVNCLERRITVRPRIPKSLGPLSAVVPVHVDRMLVKYDPGAGSLELDGRQIPVSYRILLDLEVSPGTSMSGHFSMSPKSRTRISIREDGLTVVANRDTPIQVELKKSRQLQLPPGISLLTPKLRSDMKALRLPEYRMLAHSEVKRLPSNPHLFATASDPRGDDRGTDTGAYTYPRNANFSPGCFDLRSATVTFDSAAVHFKIQLASLSNPGWHPEYGFQLTYLAIAIDTNGKAGSGMRSIGHNAAFDLDASHGFERLILVGGGIRIEDGSGKTLAEYVPGAKDIAQPLGDAAGGIIEFSLPTELLGVPGPSWSITILSGGQDDHGGAGIGEFRTVGKETEEWHGGGKARPDASNVYDVLELRPGR